MNYSDKVKAAIHDRLFTRFPPRNKSEQVMLEKNAMFFWQFTYDESEAEGRTIEEYADDEIDAAYDMQ